MYIARSLSGARMGSSAYLSGTRLRPIGGPFAIRPRMQIHFFDRSIIKTRWREINRDPLQSAGNLVRMIARGSIKRRKHKYGKPSPAGSPPRSRQPGTSPPFKQIYSVPFRLGTSVIVGMVGYGGITPVPGLHEHGGSAVRKVYTYGGQRRLKSGRMGKKISIYKPRMVHYPRRPFMEPALARAIALGRFPQFWQASISRAA